MIDRENTRSGQEPPLDVVALARRNGTFPAMLEVRPMAPAVLRLPLTGI